MGLIKNFDALAVTPERKLVLELIETALSVIQPEEVLKKTIRLAGSTLTIQDKTFDLKGYNRVFLLGFGKGSAKNTFLIEQTLGTYLTDGHVIDTTAEPFAKIKFTKGSHPLPSPENFAFTENIIARFKDLKLTEKDLILVVICGGGSAMFESPHHLSFEQKLAVDKALIKSGANIGEINIVRKHLSKVKGGGLAGILSPATTLTLIFSDVPGNDLSTIASGPTVKDKTTIDDAMKVLQTYNIEQVTNLSEKDFEETPKDDTVFSHVQTFIILSNRTALLAMKAKAQELGLVAEIYSDKFQSEAKLSGKKLIEDTPAHFIHLVGGETTVKATGKGRGGRNQEVVLGALPYLDDTTIIASFDSDGWDFDTYAGAIGDKETVKKARESQLNPEEYLKNNDSLAFFEKTGDAIDTGRLPSNVSDLMIIFRK